MPASELQRIADEPPTARLDSLTDYISRAEAKLREARTLRDRAIWQLRTETDMSRAQIAARAGVSLAHVGSVFRAFDLAGGGRLRAGQRPRSLRAVGGEPLNVDLKDGKPVRRAERQPKRGGSGSPPIKQEVEER